jgi:hypothetical protein
VGVNIIINGYHIDGIVLVGLHSRDIFGRFVKKEIRIPCFYPANGEEIKIKTKRRMEALASASLLTSIRQASFDGGLGTRFPFD